MLAFRAWQPTRSGVFGGEPRFVAVRVRRRRRPHRGAVDRGVGKPRFRRCCRREKMVAVGALNSISVRVVPRSPRCRRSGSSTPPVWAGRTRRRRFPRRSRCCCCSDCRRCPPTAHPAAPHGPGPDDSDAEHDPPTQSIRGVPAHAACRRVGDGRGCGGDAPVRVWCADPRPWPTNVSPATGGPSDSPTRPLAVGALLAAITSGWLPGYAGPACCS